MALPQNKEKLFFRRVSYFLQKLFTSIALFIFDILKFILVDFVYEILILRIIYPILHWLFTKPLYYLGFFIFKIVFGICDLVFAVLYKLSELLLLLVLGIHKLVSYFFDKILMFTSIRVIFFKF